MSLQAKRILSGEPLPVQPEFKGDKISVPELNVFFRKLIDYIRRLTGKLDRIVENTGSGLMPLIFSGYKTADSAVSDSAYSPVTWEAQLRIDEIYVHTPPSAVIQVLEDGLYEVEVDLRITDAIATYTKVSIVDSGGTEISTPAYAYSQFNVDKDNDTVSFMVPIVLSANDYVSVFVKAEGASGGNTLDQTGSRIMIIKFRDSPQSVYPEAPACPTPVTLQDDARVTADWRQGRYDGVTWIISDANIANAECCCDETTADDTITLVEAWSELEQFDPPGGASFSLERCDVSVPSGATAGFEQFINGFPRNAVDLEYGVRVRFYDTTVDPPTLISDNNVLKQNPVGPLNCMWDGFGTGGGGGAEYSFSKPLHFDGLHPRSVGAPLGIPNDYPTDGVDTNDWQIISYTNDITCSGFTAQAVWEFYDTGSLKYRVTAYARWTVT